MYPYLALSTKYIRLGKVRFEYVCHIKVIYGSREDAANLIISFNNA